VAGVVELMRYPLGNDQHGNPIDVPAEAAAWRVRIGGSRRGRPRNVFDPDTGRQFEVALGSTLDDLREAGLPPGRYRLEAVDREGNLLPGVVALTELADGEDDDGAPTSVEMEPLARMLQTIEKQTDTLCRALEAMARAFGPVHPAKLAIVEAEPPAPVVSPEVVQGIAGAVKTVAEAWNLGGHK
jgi:hypothetical protein